MNNSEDVLKNIVVIEDNSDASWALWDRYSALSGPPAVEVRVKEPPPREEKFRDIFKGVKVRNDT